MFLLQRDWRQIQFPLLPLALLRKWHEISKHEKRQKESKVSLLPPPEPMPPTPTSFLRLLSRWLLLSGHPRPLLLCLISLAATTERVYGNTEEDKGQAVTERGKAAGSVVEEDEEGGGRKGGRAEEEEEGRWMGLRAPRKDLREDKSGRGGKEGLEGRPVRRSRQPGTD